MLELREVSRSAGRNPVLKRVSFSISPGSSLSVLGLDPLVRPSFLRVIEGAEQADAGVVLLGGQPVVDARKKKGAVLRVNRQGIAASGKTVRRILESSSGRGGSVAEAAGRAGLSGQMEVAAKQLGLDQRLRLALACALLERPALLLLDTPAADLHGEMRQRFLADLPALLEGMPGVVVHAVGSADEAKALGGDVLVLDKGKALQLGTSAEVFAHPGNLTVAASTSWPALNVVTFSMGEGFGVLSDGSRFHPPAGLPMPAGGMCTLAFRPDDTTLERRDEGCLRFAVRAVGEETVAGRRFARLAFANAEWLAPAQDAQLAPGVIVSVFVDRSRVMVFDGDGLAVS
jgi:glycerol transport system ATP-binding protein